MRSNSGFLRVLITGAILVASAVSGSALRPGRHPQLVIDAAAALADQPVHIAVTGLTPGAQVTLVTRASDYRSQPWQARATFVAGPSGTVDPGEQAPTGGTYRGVDPMGLFWSMNPVTGDPGTAAFSPLFPQVAPSFAIELSAYLGTQRIAVRVLTRRWMASGVTHRRLALAHDGVVGDLFLPPPGSTPHPAVLAFGGSEGGESMNYAAALLASHGYRALSLGYFALPGLPKTLRDIPLEYFAAAARALAAQPGVDPAHVLAMGYSRGTEAALLLADLFPDLVHGAVLYAPSAVINVGFPGGGAAWTLHGEPVTLYPIPVDHVSGPVLALGGQNDGLWDSADWAEQIDHELSVAGSPYPHHALVFPDAGHGLGTFPYLPAATSQLQPVTHQRLDLGGTRAGNEAAQQTGWGRVLALLASL